MKNYYVVKIIDEKTIVINAGIEDKIKKGDKFEIYYDSDVVIDPITKENLGSYTIVKDSVEVISIFDKISICKGIMMPGTFLNATNALTNLISSERKNLNVDKTEISGYGNDTTKIKIGDKVRLKINLPLPEESTKN